MIKIRMDAPRAWGIYFQDSATPATWFGKSPMWVILPNSGDILKPWIPSCVWKHISGRNNYSSRVISQRMMETAMDDRGSKSITTVCQNVIVKEQRVNGNNIKWMLRCTLMDSERDYQVKIPSNQINNKRNIVTMSNSEQQSMINP